MSFNAMDSESSASGELAQSAPVALSGFSKSRWLFWEQRLGEIGQCCEELVAKQACYAVSLMNQQVKEITQW
jgi:hypothetical protein